MALKKVKEDLKCGKGKLIIPSNGFNIESSWFAVTSTWVSSCCPLNAVLIASVLLNDKGPVNGKRKLIMEVLY